MNGDGRIVIVGGGWAGLAAAVEIARAGQPVLLLEAAPHLGGRARSVELDGFGAVDNGQHLLLGANETVLQLLDAVGIAEPEVLRRLPLDLALREPDGPGALLSTSYLPAPLHLVAGLMTMEGASLSERFNTLLNLKALMRGPDGKDMPLNAWLRAHDMPPRISELLWKPLCLAILNLPAGRASAELFSTVLREVFTGHRSRSDLLVPCVPLGEVFPEPARRFIEANGGEVRTLARITALATEQDVCTGVMIGDEHIPARRVILATAPWHAAPLLAPHRHLTPIAQNLERLGDEPITTVWLRYPQGTRPERPLFGMLGTTAQWVFDRGACCGEDGIISVVVSGRGPHLDLHHDALAAQVAAELAQLYPDWPEPLAARVLREKRATFSPATGCETLRPDDETPMPGLWLAGDYTRTGLPATLEGAVRSGIRCARAMIDL